MMYAHQYPVSLGYKETYMPYYGNGGSIYSGHHGIDYACPTGTKVLLGGTVVGLSGATGLVNGAHLHVDKSIDGSRNYSSYRNPSDFYKQSGVVTFAGDAGTAGLMIVIKADNGAIYRLLHLSKINVKVGQKVGETMSKAEEYDVRIMAYGQLGNHGYNKKGVYTKANNALDKDFKRHMGNIGKETRTVLRSFYRSGEGENSRNTIAELAKRTRLSYKHEEQLKDQAIIIKDQEAQIKELQGELLVCASDSEDTIRLNALGKLLQQIVKQVQWFIIRLGLKEK